MNHFQRYLADEFVEDYQEGRLTRRQALKLIASVTGSLLLAQNFLAACAPPPVPPTNPSPTSPNPPEASPTAGKEPTAGPATNAAPGTAPIEPPTAAPVSGTVSPDDPAIRAASVEFDNASSTITGYLAQPQGSGSFPVVLVCHENRGLTDHIKDVTRRLAKAGYVGLAVDLLSRQGGSAALGPDQVPGVLGNIAPGQFVADFVAGWSYLKGLPVANADLVAMAGFCFGGGVTWLVATGMPELKAAVPFYGPPPPVDDIPKINAAVLAIYGGRDQRITGTIPAVESAMQASGKIYEKVIYPDADHAFFNDTGSRYYPEAAQDAWARTLGWLRKYLTG